AELRIERSAQAAGPSHRPRRLRKVVFWCFILAVVAAGALFLKEFFNSGVEVQLTTASLTSPAQASSVLTASGYVVARRKAAVASKGTGTLVFLGVDEGDEVKKGQVIARLDDSDVSATLRRAQENLRMVEADLNDAKQSLERQTILLKRGIVAQAEYDAVEARYQRVVASIEAAKFAVREAEVAVENTRIVAPFDGTVLKKNADIGEIVAPLAGAVSSKAAVVTIADMSSLEVEADVSEANLTRVVPGQDCEIRLDAYPERSYMGYVGKIVPTADRSKATVLVKIKFKNYDRRVLPDMGAKISFLSPDRARTAESNQPFLAVPRAAVTVRNGRQVIYRVRDGRALEVPVVVGRQIGNLVEIKQGLQNGDKIVSKVDEKIRNGAKVYLSNP
ncbi:MAG TPA: efflux RND transporter periplasmic adaptor subunit, partial [Candidatus Acidoferrales bacterium]|nr:efflux RND transporter periplasmic adaptor subunit [Candidatus Acidoferrales bacterium]